MRLGTIHSFEFALGQADGASSVYAEEMEQIVESERLGYDWVNITEHHVTDDGYCPALMPVLAAVAVLTKKLGLSTGMLILPLHHPIRIAEEAAVVDNLSGGRLTLGVAAGYRELEFEVLGSDYKTRGTRLDESIEILKLAWSGEPFSYDGQTISIPEVVVQPRPVQRPHPPLWLGGASQRALRRAAQQGAPCFPGATSTVAEVSDIYARFLDLREELDREGESPGFVLPRLAYVGDTMEEARKLAHPAIDAMFDRYVAYGNPPRVREALADWELLDQYVIVGDEDYCAERVRELSELGVTDLMLQFAMPGLASERVTEAMRRFAGLMPKAT